MKWKLPKDDNLDDRQLATLGSYTQGFSQLLAQNIGGVYGCTTQNTPNLA